MLISFLFSLRMELTEERWDAFREKNPEKPIFAMLYAPWCSNCKKVHPTFIKLQDEYENDPDVLVAGADCDQHGALCKKNNVTGYPTFVEVFYNIPHKFSPDREYWSFLNITQHLKETVRGPPKATNFSGSFSKFPSFLFTLNKDDNETKYFIMHASYTDGIDESQILMKFVEEKIEPKLEIYIDDTKKIDIVKPITTENIIALLKQITNPLIDKFTFKEIEEMTTSFTLFVGKNNDNKEFLTKISKQFCFESSWGNAAVLGEKKVLEVFGIKSADYPILITYFPEEDQFVYKGGVKTVDEVTRYFDEIKKGILRKEVYNAPKEEPETHKAKKIPFLWVSLAFGVAIVIAFFVFRLRRNNGKIE